MTVDAKADAQPRQVIQFDGSFFHYRDMHGTVYIEQRRGPKLHIWAAPIDVRDSNHVISMGIAKKPDYITDPASDAYVAFLVELQNFGLPPMKGYEEFVPNAKLRRMLEKGAKPGPKVSMRVPLPWVPEVIGAVREAGYDMVMHRSELTREEKPVAVLPRGSYSVREAQEEPE